MAKSLKLNDEHYWDSTSVVHEKEKLNELLNSINEKIDDIRNELLYKSGDTLSLYRQDVILGYITTGATQVILTIVTNKSMRNVQPVLTYFSMIARGTSGYLNNSTSEITNTTSGYTFTTVKVSDRIIRLTITNSSAFTNVTNNTPVSGSMEYKFTFE